MAFCEIVLRFNEVALKGTNRGRFEKILGNNAKMMVDAQSTTPAKYHWLRGRLILQAEWSLASREALSRIFGLVGFSPVVTCPAQKEILIQTALECFEDYLQEFGKPVTYRVKARRAEKIIPESSAELEREIGSLIAERHPEIKVDLAHPQMTLGIEIRKRGCIVWAKNYPGPGGLPVGTNSRVLTLLSGGIDSPVAALRMMRRGSPSDFIFFHGAPFVGQEVQEKVRDLACAVSRYSTMQSRLWVIPFGKIQETIALHSDSRVRTLLYRRMMLRIATQVAVETQIGSLVTGDSLGQVASQTLENLAVINSATTLPIHRPLIGMDKEEIVRQAIAYKTYEISIRPGEDCCTLFADRHPTLRAELATIEEMEKDLPIESLIQQGCEEKQLFQTGLPLAYSAVRIAANSQITTSL